MTVYSLDPEQNPGRQEIRRSYQHDEMSNTLHMVEMAAGRIPIRARKTFPPSEDQSIDHLKWIKIPTLILQLKLHFAEVK